MDNRTQAHDLQLKLEGATAMTIELKPAQEQLIRDAVDQGRFRSVDEALDRALQSIAPFTAPVDRPGLAETAVRLRELRKGNRLPPGTTLRDLIDYGRA
jgi:hypothetical protein